MTTENGGMVPAPEDRVMQYVPFASKDPIKLSVSIIKSMVSARTRSGKVCTDEDAMKFMMLCRARALNPFEGDAFLVGYDNKDGSATFSLITAHQAFLKRAEPHPEYDGMESGVIVRDAIGNVIDREGDFTFDDDVILGGWATVHFKNRKHPMKKRLRLSTFHKDNNFWRSNPAGMICKCFDEETEVLTTNGFERFADVAGAILQVTDGGLEATDATPFVQNYVGQMVTMESDDLNFSVTPNHDMLTTGGKIEAGEMFNKARSRPNIWIPRCTNGLSSDFGVSDSAIELAAIYLADGQDKPHKSFWVGVSRLDKIAAIEKLGMHHSRHVAYAAGAVVDVGTRLITTKTDKQMFGFDYKNIAPLVSRAKAVSVPVLLALSRRQAKIFVDTLVSFDGSTNKKTGVRRFYSSRPNLMAAFEIAAIAAGYSVSYRRERTTDLSDRVNFSVSISERSEIGVRRWGRPYHNLEVEKWRRPGSLELTNNKSGRVWCVTVPSGLIIVRRNGFSMVCGNCAEADALRSAFPTILGGMYSAEEMSPPVVIETVQARTVPAELPVGRSRIGGTRKQPSETAAEPAPVAPTSSESEQLPAPVTPPLQQPTGTLFSEPPATEAKPMPSAESKIAAAPDDLFMADIEETLTQQIESSVTQKGLQQVGVKLKERAAQFGSHWKLHCERLEAAFRKKFNALAK